MSRRVRDIALAAFLLGLPALFLWANLKSPDRINAFDRVVLKVSAPIEAGVTAVTSAVHGTWHRYVHLVDVQADNDRLRDEKQTLQLELREAKRELQRLAQYERLLAFRAARGVETVGARVIGRASSPFVRALRVRIDRGTMTVQPGQAVISADGVVGRVSRVFGAYSEVRLAVDPKSAIDVVIQRTGARGLLKGIEGTNRYVCRLHYLLRREPVNVGDVVVTSGAAGAFPKDLPVGRISKLVKRSYGLYQDVEVTPAVDYGTLSELLVILARRPPPVQHAEAGSVPAYGFVP